MKKFIACMAVTAMVFGNPAFADQHASPTENFDMTKLMTNKTLVTIRAVPNVKEACFNQAMAYQVTPNFKSPKACSFWTKDFCVIIVNESANIESLGHELLHCIKGNWH